MNKAGTFSFSGFRWLMILGAVFALSAISPALAGAFGTGTISGKVTDSEGHPLAKVCVTSFDSTDSGSSDQTDTNGNYSIGFAETRDYRILFSRCGEDVNVFDEWYDDKPTKAQSTLVSATDGADTPGINAQLATAGSFSGKVTNGPNGPLQGTCVTAFRTSGGSVSYGVTDSNGDYRVVGLESGAYKVKFERCNPIDNSVSEFYPDKASFDEATTISVTAGSDTPNINAELTSGGMISGWYEVGSPVAPVFCGGSLSVYDESGNEVRHVSFAPGTGAAGDYFFHQLRAGDYRVGYDFTCAGELDFNLGYSETAFYRGSGDLAGATPVHVTPGAQRTGINVIQGGGASIAGTVTDASGNPLEDICVDTYDDQGNLGNFGRTGPDGTYLIDQFTAGSYRLKFSDCLNPETGVVPEFYDDKASLEESAPVTLTKYQDLSGIDAELKIVGPETTDPKPAKLSLKVNGPSKVRYGKKVTYRVRISNSGETGARGVKLKLAGAGSRAGTTVGKVPAGKTRTVEIKLRPKKSGKSKLTFTVTSKNAKRQSIQRQITVKTA